MTFNPLNRRAFIPHEASPQGSRCVQLMALELTNQVSQKERAWLVGNSERVGFNTMSTELEILHLAALAPPTPADWFHFSQTEPIPVPEGAAWCDGCKAGADCDRTESCAKMANWAELDHQRRNEDKKREEMEWRLAWANALAAEFLKHFPKGVE